MKFFYLVLIRKENENEILFYLTFYIILRLNCSSWDNSAVYILIKNKIHDCFILINLSIHFYSAHIHIQLNVRTFIFFEKSKTIFHVIGHFPVIVELYNKLVCFVMSTGLLILMVNKDKVSSDYFEING